MDKGILGKGNQQSIPPKRINQKQTTRTRKATTQTAHQEKKINPIHATLTSEFNPIFDELLLWMKEVQDLAAKTRLLAFNDPRRFDLEDTIENILLNIASRADAIVEQVIELTPE